MTEHIVICPSCEGLILISKLNCSIFRHGVVIRTGKQIPPHSDKNTCDRLYNECLIYGCGKPFKIDIIGDLYVAVQCDYI